MYGLKTNNPEFYQRCQQARTLILPIRKAGDLIPTSAVLKSQTDQKLVFKVPEQLHAYVLKRENYFPNDILRIKLNENTHFNFHIQEIEAKRLHEANSCKGVMLNTRDASDDSWVFILHRKILN